MNKMYKAILAAKKIFSAAEEVKDENLSDVSETTTDVKCLDAKLVDGTIIRTEGESFKVGDKVSVITEAGEVVDAPEGMHELEDGTVLVIDAEAKITEVRAQEVNDEEQAADVAPESPEAPADEKKEEDAIKMLADRMTALETVVAQIAEMMKSKESEMAAVVAENAELKIENEKMSAAPAVKSTPIKKFEAAAKEFKNMTMLEKVMASKISK